MQVSICLGETEGLEASQYLIVNHCSVVGLLKALTRVREYLAGITV